MRKIAVILLLVSVFFAYAKNRPFVMCGQEVVKIACDTASAPVISAAFDILSGDISSVLDGKAEIGGKDASITAAVINPSIDRMLDDRQKIFLNESREAFILKTLPSGRLLIAGSDPHGVAYGMLEVSRLMGVSPWEWWADAIPEKRERFELPFGYVNEQSPSVEYRGIFINDEDWGLMPWSSMTMEPSNRSGVIGPKTTEKIFELLLRLRANTYWPPMHECSEPFFLTPGNREAAEKYGIYIGGSHCEPMASSTAVEWGRRGVGEYDYVNNGANVLRFWEERVKDVAGQEIIYTLGMRGVHDGAMNGAKTVGEQKSILTKAIFDQRSLLSQHVDKDITKVPQVFIPYKEVLDVYNAGLDVPEDVTLMWCDDNYGYIRHFPTEPERQRKGGNGIYYHVSYWGRPHDYLWLGTFSPYLLYQQMHEAYNRGIQKMWILNVGDIKPAEYQIELFMDMAWNMESVCQKGVQSHMKNFLAREFGIASAEKLLPIMNRHYHLAFIRKPEFLGNTRCEEYGPGSEKWYVVSDLPWSDEYISTRIKDYQALSDDVEQINKDIVNERLDTYFQLVKYPVQAAAEMNKKMLYGQLARHCKAEWEKCQSAFDSIAALTAIYNNGINNGGKWNGIMDFQPRRQPVFAPLDSGMTSIEPKIRNCRIIEGRSHQGGNVTEHYGLGHTGHAVEIPKGETVTYHIAPGNNDSIMIKLNFIPNHPINECDGLKVLASLGNGSPMVIDYSTKGRSEEWKENILNGKATRTLTFPINNLKNQDLKISALSDGIILDYIEVLTENINSK